jgi:hypothetical protein
MTEEQAKGMLCPKTIKAVKSLLDGRELIGAPCVASHCMAWRWNRVFNEELRTPESPFHGYCGLAGKE